MKVPKSTCLDDLYVLDVEVKEWVKVACSLAPLARKGHTMNAIRIDGNLHLVLFGGYSIENVTMSNTVHVCEVESVLQYCKLKRAAKSEQNAQGHVNKVKARKIDASNRPVVWRTLKCTGTPPPPRYRHTSTVVYGRTGERMMVVMGGIGQDPKIPLNDAYTLNLSTFEWGCSTSIGVSTGTAGGDGIGLGPFTGIYGHVAIPAAERDTSDDKYKASFSGQKTTNTELLLFGGSFNTASPHLNCNYKLTLYDPVTNRWRSVPTGYAFPSARNNLSATVVHGWAPQNPVPTNSPTRRVVDASKPEDFKRVNTSSGAQMCAVIFGGVNSVQRASDTWALDLAWRPHGVDQFDDSAKHQEDSALQTQDISETASEVELNLLNANKLLSKAEAQHSSALNRRLNAAKHTMSYAGFSQNTESDLTGRFQKRNDDKYLHSLQPSASAPSAIPIVETNVAQVDGKFGLEVSVSPFDKQNVEQHRGRKTRLSFEDTVSHTHQGESNPRESSSRRLSWPKEIAGSQDSNDNPQVQLEKSGMHNPFLASSPESPSHANREPGPNARTAQNQGDTRGSFTGILKNSLAKSYDFGGDSAARLRDSRDSMNESVHTTAALNFGKDVGLAFLKVCILAVL